ncbi:MAG: TauD/TfdA family dioxygenase [Acidiferrobacterales bacterium]|nr:TauD/TfdA family dioxygenase [Acidiferrobacterales bacterium]
MKKNKAFHRWIGALVWHGKEIEQSKNWVTYLSDSEIAELRNAVDLLKASSQSLLCSSKEDFPLATLGEKLIDLRDQILEGRGFALIRGLPVQSWNEEDLIYAYWGIGAWIGDAVSQNAQAHLLGHIIDQGKQSAAVTRLYQTNQSISFHSDSCDIVGLLCLREAKAGGASYLASSAAIHNLLLDTAPDLLDALYSEFQCDRYEEIPEGKLPYYSVKVFNNINGKLVCCGMDPDIRSAQRFEGLPPLSNKKLSALNTFQDIAKQISLRMTFRAGDMQFVNNLTVVHARESYEDYHEQDRRRYLVRLWLSSPHGRALPSFMAERWGNIEPGTIRGGVKVPGASPCITFSPHLPLG